MMGYLHQDYAKSHLMRALLDTEGIEIDKVWFMFDEILDQAFIETASWGLEIWEEEWGLTPDPNDTYEERRSRIKGRIAGTGSFTEQAAIDLANAYSRTRSARFIPLYSNYTFKTIYEIDDLVSYSGLKTAFNEVKPAHLLHIVGLLIEVPSDFHAQAAAKMKSRAIIDSGWRIESKAKWKMLYQFLGFGELEVSDPGSLVFNGTWQFDGTRFFNGINEKGIDVYLAASMPCFIRLSQRISIPFPIEIQSLATVKSKALAHIQDMDAGAKFKAFPWYLGVGKYDAIDPGVLTFNGAWRFDGAHTFDGVNSKGIDLYLELADSCVVRHIRNGEIIEEETI